VIFLFRRMSSSPYLRHLVRLLMGLIFVSACSAMFEMSIVWWFKLDPAVEAELYTFFKLITGVILFLLIAAEFIGITSEKYPVAVCAIVYFIADLILAFYPHIMTRPRNGGFGMLSVYGVFIGAIYWRITVRHAGPWRNPAA
jgi:hypothetical protein